MQKGGKYKIWIPSALGYGDQDIPNEKTGGTLIPAGSVLIFDVELQDYLPRDQFEAAMRQQQEQMQKAAGAAGAGAPPPQN